MSQKFEDSHTTRRVKSALEADNIYRYPDVEVQTYDGVVQLSGFATVGPQKVRAGEIAEKQDGVRQVVNTIVLKSKITVQ